MTGADSNPAPSQGRFLCVEELRAWCSTPEGRRRTHELLAKIRTMRDDFAAEQAANLEAMRDTIAQAESNTNAMMDRYGRQIDTIETVLAENGELQA